MKAAQQRRTPKRKRLMCFVWAAIPRLRESAAVLCRFHHQSPGTNCHATIAMIAVTFALPVESSEFLRSLSSRSRSDRNGVPTIRGKIDDRAVEVLHTGVGERACRQRMGKFLSTPGRIRRGEQSQEFGCLISTGFAGALNDDLQIGDLLLAENFSTVDSRETRASLSGLPIHIANLLTVPALIDSSEKRNKLALTSGAAAVDMETEFIARACAARGIPLLSLRVISDTPRELFPAPTHVLFDIARQQTRTLKLAAYLLAHPNRLPRLVQFAQRIARARKILASALVAVVRGL
jgi:nucleoside phosphorylase